MKGRDFHLHIGNTPKRWSCGDKKRYWSQSNSKDAAHEYNRRVLFGDVGDYWCQLHGCWHIGHRDKHRSARSKLREDVTWFRMWGRRN